MINIEQGLNCEYASLGIFWCLIKIKCVFFLDAIDSEPSDEDLWKLVAKEVGDYHALGISLGLEFNQIEMMDNEYRGRTAVINMKILTTWMQKETKKPITWHTLLQALCSIDRTKLAHSIIDKLEQRQKPSP